MFYSTSDGQYIQEGTQFVVDGVTYPPQWLNQATEEQKAEIGLEEVIATNSPANDQYYWVSTELNGATLTYVNNPKDLEELKKTCSLQVNQTAYSLLFPSDWMVIKSQETGTEMNQEWKDWRSSIRKTAADTNDLINSANSVDILQSIMSDIVWQESP